MIKPLFRKIPQWPIVPTPQPVPIDGPAPVAPATGIRSLQSSALGDLAQVVLVFPFGYFGMWEEPQQQVALLASYAALLKTLPEECEVVAVINAADPEPAKTWIAAQKRPGLLKIIPIPIEFSGWPRDPFCTVLVDGVPHLVEPNPFPIKNRPNDPLLADELAPILGHPREVGDDAFAGGNVLAGVDNIYVGADVAAKIMHMQGESDEQAVIRALTEIETAGTRSVIVVGTKDEVPAAQKVELGGGIFHIYHSGNETGTHQPLFHIDMFMTVAIGKDGRDAVVLGRPSLARKTMPDAWPLAAELDVQLGEIGDLLRARGVAVHEIPMPMFGVAMSNTVTKFLYAPYPNALVETGSRRRVWLPQFSMFWKEVQGIDDDVADLWRNELGYEVSRIPGCTQFAMDLAGVHCATHDILRRTTL